MSDLRQFELLEDLRPFGSADAVLMKWNGGQYVRTQEKIQIFDFIGARGDRHDRGYARQSMESLKWEAISGLQEPKESWLPF
jgi:hypothetical protein